MKIDRSESVGVGGGGGGPGGPGGWRKTWYVTVSLTSWMLLSSIELTSQMLPH